MIHRLVCLGWKDEARDLLFVHTEYQDPDAQPSMTTEVGSRSLPSGCRVYQNLVAYLVIGQQL